MTLFTFQNLFQNDTDVQSRLSSDLSYLINSRAMPVSWNSWIFVQIPVCLTINYILYWLCHITSFITITTKLYRKEQNSTKVEFGIVIEICDKLWPIYWLHDLTLHNQSSTKCYWLNRYFCFSCATCLALVFAILAIIFALISVLLFIRIKRLNSSSSATTNKHSKVAPIADVYQICVGEMMMKLGKMQRILG